MKKMLTVTVMFLAAAGIAQAGGVTMTHYYNFNEGSGTNVFDQVATNPQHGEFSFMKSDSDWTTGHSGGGLQFNGVRGDGIADDPPVHGTRRDRMPLGPTGDVVYFGDDTSFALVNRGSIMFWMRQDPGPDGDGTGYGNDGALNNPDNANWIIAKGNDPFNYIVHNQHNYTGMRFEWRAAGDVASARGSGLLAVEEWVHVAATWDSDSDEKHLYVNGVLEDTQGFGGIDQDWGGNFVVGGHDAHTGAGRGFLGKIDELRVFDGLLTQSEVQTYMSIPEPGTLALLGLGGLLLAIRRRR